MFDTVSEKKTSLKCLKSFAPHQSEFEVSSWFPVRQFGKIFYHWECIHQCWPPCTVEIHQNLNEAVSGFIQWLTLAWGKIKDKNESYDFCTGSHWKLACAVESYFHLLLVFLGVYYRNNRNVVTEPSWNWDNASTSVNLDHLANKWK